jgi:hypothetical protein
VPPRKREPTEAPRAMREERLASKKRQGGLKASRRSPRV